MRIDWKKFGQLIREDRERLKMKQAEYAVLLGLKPSLQGKISLIEAGKIKSPAYETVQRIKAQLGLVMLPGEDKERRAPRIQSAPPGDARTGAARTTRT